jgi:hypothetical protein
MNTFKRKALFAAVLAGSRSPAASRHRISSAARTPARHQHHQSHDRHRPAERGLQPRPGGRGRALLPDDPAPACIHAVLVKSGIEVPAGAVPAQSFVPKKDGVASAGAIAYIIAQQARRLSKQKLSVDPSCEALVGRVVIDGARDFNKVGVAAIRLLAP